MRMWRERSIGRIRASPRQGRLRVLTFAHYLSPRNVCALQAQSFRRSLPNLPNCLWPPLGVQCPPVLKIAVARMPPTSCPRRPPKQLQLGFWEPLFSYCALLGFSQRLTHHESPLEECRHSFSVCTQFPKNSGCQVQHAVSIRRMPSGDNAILCLRKASAYAI